MWRKRQVEVGVLGCGAVTAVWMWRKRQVEVGVLGGGADTAVWMWRKRRVEVGVLADGAPTLGRSPDCRLDLLQTHPQIHPGAHVGRSQVTEPLPEREA